MADQLFTEPKAGEIDPSKNYMEDLVGDGKKFATPEELAKGKVQSDLFITTLQGELEELREELQKRLTMEEFMDRMKNVEPNPSNPPVPAAGETIPAPQPELPDIETLVNKQLQAKEKELAEATNVASVRNALQAAWGPTYEAELALRTEKMGYTQDFISTLAKEKPDAVLKLLDVTEAPREQFLSPPTSQLNSTANETAMSATGAKPRSYYVKLKQTDPATYFSKENKAKMHRDSTKLGEAFFDVDE